jgi:hypothetical protein
MAACGSRSFDDWSRFSALVTKGTKEGSKALEMVPCSLLVSAPLFSVT